jgi:hypothetical protein
MAVPVESGATFRYGNARSVVEGPYLAPVIGRSYDVSRDGQRFLVMKDATATVSGPSELVVVLNWLEELKRLVPVP